MLSTVAAFSAVSMAWTSGMMSTFVLSRMRPDSGARRARMGHGWGKYEGCASQWCGDDTHANPSRDAAATMRMASSMSALALRVVGLQNGVR